ncbi:response regulator [Rubrivirga sp. S365]|uniref:response regulator n=1 Tax=Rubrivirga sp. S365 TaxID=3076080 RepID=UPI0028C9CBA1|nr:response regulator [Rubrivirga sp. S365]MDT7856049.1 response regulator [Rubrivirga sp. S365]
MRALLIDDSRTVRAVVRAHLAALGFDVAEAADGREGLDQLRTGGAVDVMLVDWNMPVMNGLEFVRTVRANAAFDGVPVVMVTTESDVGSVAAALDAGATEYVMKPFTRDILDQKLRLAGLDLHPTS